MLVRPRVDPVRVGVGQRAGAADRERPGEHAARLDRHRGDLQHVLGRRARARTGRGCRGRSPSAARRAGPRAPRARRGRGGPARGPDRRRARTAAGGPGRRPGPGRASRWPAPRRAREHRSASDGHGMGVADGAARRRARGRPRGASPRRTGAARCAPRPAANACATAASSAAGSSSSAVSGAVSSSTKSASRHGDQRRAAGLDEHRPLAGPQRRVALAQDREVEGGIPERPRERDDLLERAAHTAVYAPSMTMLWPTMYDEASEHRKTTRPSRSLGSPMRPAGIMPRQRSASSGLDSVNCRVMSDRK